MTDWFARLPAGRRLALTLLALHAAMLGALVVFALRGGPPVQ